MAPSIKRFCDHRVILHRFNADTSPRDEFLDIVPAWELVPVPEGLNATLNRNWGGALADSGPGEIQVVMRQWFLLPEFDIRERDILEAVEGPETGKLYKVESVSAGTGPIVIHHFEAMATIAAPDALTVVPATS